MEAKEKELRTTLCLILLAVTAAVYAQVAGAEFINYDDSAFVWDNSHSNTGLSLDNFKWAFTTLHGGTSYYQPLTWLTYQADTQIFGLSAGALHLTNVLFHLANSVLLLVFLHRATGCLWRSAMVAALFALHPLHVETVCWTSERKSLVSAFFWMLTMLAYLRYVRMRGTWNYSLVLVAFTASVISKPMAVTLPFVLLLLDFWPLGRIQLGGLFRPRNSGEQVIAEQEEEGSFQTKEAQILEPAGSRPSQAFVEKLPMIAIAAVICALTVLAQRQLGAMVPLKKLPLTPRLANSVVGYVLYIRKMFWPVDLAPIYPFRHDWGYWLVGAAATFLLAATRLCWTSRFRHPAFLVGWLWFLGTLFPMIGIVQVGAQGLADRYSYMSLTGLFIALVWGGDAFPSKMARLKPLFGPVAAVLLALCAIATGGIASYWKNSIRLFDHAIQVTRDNAIAEATLGMAYAGQENQTEALFHLRNSLAIYPGQGRLYGHVAQAALRNGDTTRALGEVQHGLEIAPDEKELHGLLASIFADSSNPRSYHPKDAVEQARRACEISEYRDRTLLVLLAHACFKAENYHEAAIAAQRFLDISVSPREVRQARALVNKLVRWQAAHRTEISAEPRTMSSERASAANAGLQSGVPQSGGAIERAVHAAAEDSHQVQPQ